MFPSQRYLVATVIHIQSLCSQVCVCVYTHTHTHARARARTHFTKWKSCSGLRNTKIGQHCQWITLEHAKHRLSLPTVCSKHTLITRCIGNSLWNVMLLECILNRRPSMVGVSEKFLLVKAEVLWHVTSWRVVNSCRCPGWSLSDITLIKFPMPLPEFWISA